MSGTDIDAILERIGSAELVGKRHSVLLTFRQSDGSERPFWWCPVAELEKRRGLAAQTIARTVAELASESLAGQAEALGLLKAYVLGLSDNHRPSHWDTEFMDEDDIEYFERDLREAIRCCVGREDDAFRVAYRIARKLMIDADIGIIAVAEELIRKAAKIPDGADLPDRAAAILASRAEENSQFLRNAFRKFLESQQESRSTPSP